MKGKVKRLALERRAQLALGARYQVVGLGSPAAILRHWRCTNDGTEIKGEDEYGSHIHLHPNHQIVALSTS
jgi:hypothetical protein